MVSNRDSRSGPKQIELSAQGKLFEGIKSWRGRQTTPATSTTWLPRK